MAAGDATSADVPGKYDCVINGKGYVFADTVDPSLPFRTHRAIYDISQTFVERSNTSNQYGDQTQDFFLTASQNDWSEGEQQRFFRASSADSVARYWTGVGADRTVPGQISLLSDIQTATLGGTIAAGSPNGTSNAIFLASSSNLYEVTAGGSITDHGAHGAGAPNGPRAIASDGFNVYIAGATAVRKWDGSSFTSFSTDTTTVTMVYVDNTLYGLRGGGLGTTNELVLFDTSGVVTSIFTWKNASGGTPSTVSSIAAFGGKVLILRMVGDQGGSDLWLYDGTAPTKLSVFPKNFLGTSLCVAQGTIFVAGSLVTTNTPAYESCVFYVANGTQGILWRAKTTSTANTGSPQITEFNGGVVWTDEAEGLLKFYEPSLGGVSTLASLSGTGSFNFNVISASDRALALGRNSTTAYIYPATTKQSSVSVSTSLFDFDNSLTKIFRGVKVDFVSATDGDGGSVDISYQVDSLDGSYTSLKTGATSGTEYNFSSVSGHSISIKITLNKGTSTLGPILKRVYVRAAPELQQFKSGLYIIDCTNTEGDPRQLRDETYHPLTGYDQVQNLLTAAKSTTPFSVTDKVNGTFTALVDLSDTEGWDVYEVHPDPDNPKKPGSYLVRIKVREV